MHLGHQQHVRALGRRARSTPQRRSAQHRGGERTERLPELDLQVHRRLHLAAARVADDRAAAERARAELHPPLEPADHVSPRRSDRATRSARASRSRRSGAALMPAVREETARSPRRRRRGPSSEAFCRSRLSVDARASPSRSWWRTKSAAPSAPPASPAAGWIQMFSNGPSRRIRRWRRSSARRRRPGRDSRMPVCAWAWRGHRQHDLLGHHLDRRRPCPSPAGSARSRARAAGRRRGARTARWSSSGRRSSRSTSGSA